MTTETKTLASQTMLAAIELGLPPQATQLKIEATKIEEEQHAQKGTVKPPSITYFRKEIPNPEYVGKKGQKKWLEVDGLEELKDFQREYKNAVRALARYPYGVGLYLAPAPMVDELVKLKGTYETQLAEIWMHWADTVYPQWADTAAQRMGQLYDPGDFPSLTDCRKCFRAELILIPLAEKDQIARITLISPTSKQLLMDHADAKGKEAIAELHKQIWADLMKPLKHVVDVFTKDKAKIHETMLSNLLEIVNVIPNYKELCQDPELEAAAAAVKEVFSQITTEDLRKSEEARGQALFQAKALVAKFDPFARKFA